VGNFVLLYKPSANQTYQSIQNLLRQSRLFESLVNDLNSSGLVLRRDVPVTLQDCGTANAFYSPKDKSITMCHELFVEVAADLQKLSNSSLEEALESSIYASIFVFYHELGHALIDILALPSVGKEEDAVDQFAVYSLMQSGTPELVQKTVLNAAIWFKSNPEIPAWAEHAPNDVRFYNLVCLVYGSNPDGYQFLLKYLPEPRAVRCPKEYTRMAGGWYKLILPHIAQGPRPWGNGTTNTPRPNPGQSTVRPGRRW
jgi:hypothetical protein